MEISVTTAMKNEQRQPRISYIDICHIQDLLAEGVKSRSKYLAKIGPASRDACFGSLAMEYASVALDRYALGYPLDVVAEDLRGEVGALREMFRHRGTSGVRHYVYENRPAPPEAVASGDAPFFRVAVEANESDLGPTDYSTTNSRTGFLSVCKALVVGDEAAERELIGMIWDPPGATYVGTNSELCTFNDQRIAYALKAYYEGDAARFAAELRGVRAPKRHVAGEVMMLRGIVARDKALIIQGLDALLRWHRKEAAHKSHRNYSWYYVCVSALGLARLAIREGICTPHDLPADEPFLPLELFNAGPNARSYTNKILVPFDPKRPDWNSNEFLTPRMQSEKAILIGLETKTEYDLGRVIFAEKTVSEKDFCGEPAESKASRGGDATLARLGRYIEMLQTLRIGNIVILQHDSGETMAAKVVASTSADFMKRYNVCHCNAHEAKSNAV